MVRFLMWLLITFVGRGGEMLMVTVIVALIIAGRRTFDQVPDSLKPAVEADLSALGLGTDGLPLPAGE